MRTFLTIGLRYQLRLVRELGISPHREGAEKAHEATSEPGLFANLAATCALQFRHLALELLQPGVGMTVARCAPVAPRRQRAA
jgi:hypothetical protein